MEEKKWFSKKGKIQDLDRSFDYEFWQTCSATARFAEAWQMALFYHVNIKGEDEDQLRLQRSLVELKPIPS
jgi:hypothetical protein